MTAERNPQAPAPLLTAEMARRLTGLNHSNEWPQVWAHELDALHAIASGRAVVVPATPTASHDSERFTGRFTAASAAPAEGLGKFSNLLAVMEPLGLSDDTPLREVMPGAWPTLGDLKDLARRLRAPVPPPARHLTVDERSGMHRALMKSVTRVDPPPADDALVGDLERRLAGLSEELNACAVRCPTHIAVRLRDQLSNAIAALRRGRPQQDKTLAVGVEQSQSAPAGARLATSAVPLTGEKQ